MLKKLRLKFTLVITILCSLILAAVLVSSLYTTARSQQLVINNALEEGTEGSIDRVPKLGSANEGGSVFTRMPVMLVEVNSSGVVLAANDATTSANVETLNKVISEALASSSDTGRLGSEHLSWRRASRSDGWRIVVVDTSASDYIFRSQVMQGIFLLAIGVLTMFGAAWLLSSWLLQPVTKAWDQQHRFIADASHELKTPLAVIIANTEILSKDKSISPDAQRWVRSTADESSHMKSLVEELLELARTDEGSMEGTNIIHHDDVNFSDQVDNATLEFDAVAFEHGCTIESTIEKYLHVLGDAEWTRRLIRILLDNAIKYAAVGSTVTVSLQRDGRRCTLAVNNKGDVIAPDDLEHIFDRFYRSDKARTRQPGNKGGFGLGLAIAQGIATSHKGKISATSNAEGGTTFTVTLPLIK